MKERAHICVNTCVHKATEIQSAVRDTRVHTATEIQSEVRDTRVHTATEIHTVSGEREQ